MIWGLPVAFYCATNDSSITRTNNTGIWSILEVKTLNNNYNLSYTDQVSFSPTSLNDNSFKKLDHFEPFLIRLKHSNLMGLLTKCFGEC